MSSTYARSLPAERTRRSRRAQLISLLGPATIATGLLWALLQPYRLTLLHPMHQGFWWLLIEPPLLVMAAGVIFALVVARPLLVDLEERDAASR
jgi:hypothetical protein